MPRTTVGQLIASLSGWMHEDVSSTLAMDAISDSIVSLWETLICISLSEFLGGPVQASFAPASNVSHVVSVLDPVVAPSVVQNPLGALPGAAYNVQFTWVTDDGGETLPSPVQAIVMLINNVLTVSVPNPAPLNVIGWNVYLNTYRQNQDPIAPGTDWVMPTTFVLATEWGLPTDNTTAGDVWYIESMSVTESDGSQRFWEGTEIGSELWRQFARTTAATTPFQPYVYDFDGAKISVTPLPQQAISPNYFYVKRPRKVTDATAVIPFRHPAAEMFIRYNSISLLLLSVHEFTGSSSWQKRAEQERLNIQLTAARKNSRKNLRVQPIFR